MIPKDIEVSAARAMAVVGLGRVLELAMQQAGLSSSRFRALGCVAIGVTASDLIAKFLDVSPSTVTTVMDALVTDGLVVREARIDDRRRVDYRLTPSGEAALDAASRIADAAFASMAEFIEPASRDLAFRGLDEWARAIDARRGQWGGGSR